MKSLYPFITACLLLTTPALAQTTTVNTEASTLSYSGSHPAHDWTGVSNQVTGEITFNADAPAESRVMIKAPIASFDSGNDNRDSNMLDVVNELDFQHVSFTSESIEVTAWTATEDGYTGQWQVEGTLDFHGQRRPLTIPVEVTISGAQFQAISEFPVSLKEHKVKRPKLLMVPIKDNIQMEAVIVATL